MAKRIRLTSEVKTSGNAVKIVFKGRVGGVALHGETQSFFPCLGGCPRGLASEITRIARTGHRIKSPIPAATRYALLDWVQTEIENLYQ